MSINGVGANGAGPEKINSKKVGQESAKTGFVGGLKDAIGNLLNGGKSDIKEQPIKGLSIEHTGTASYSGTVDYAGTAGYSGTVDYARGDDRGMVDYSGTGTVGYSGSADYSVDVTHADYENGQQVGSADYTATGTVGYGGTVDYMEP